MEKTDNIYRKLGSKKFALYLFIILALVLIPKTLVAEPNTFIDWSMQAVLILLLANLSFCTIQRFRSLRRATLFIHIGTIITFIGGLVSTFGYVATVNIYEGEATDLVYRWDVERDVNLGFNLGIKEVRREYYPVPVKVGVVNRGTKESLHTLMTGDSFQWGEFSVLVDSLDLEDESLMLEVSDSSDKQLGNYSTAGESTLPEEFPLTFVLVAYQDPILKNFGAVLTISVSNKTVAEGFSTVNHPFTWNGLRFFVTSLAADETGRPYIGVQVVNDKGVYMAYLGFIIICLGCLLHLKEYIWRKSD